MVIKLRLAALRRLNKSLGRNSPDLLLYSTRSKGVYCFLPSDETYAKVMKSASKLSLMLPKFRRTHYRNDIDSELASLAAFQAAYLSFFREHFIHHLEKFLFMFEPHFKSAVEATAIATSTTTFSSRQG